MDLIINNFSEQLRIAGYRFNVSKKIWWKKSSDDIYSFIEIRKNKWDNKYFRINLYIHLNRFEPINIKSLKTNKCHLFSELIDFGEIERDIYSNIFKIEERYTEDNNKVLNYLVNKVIPVLSEIMSYKNIIKYFNIENYKIKNFDLVVSRNSKGEKFKDHINRMK